MASAATHDSNQIPEIPHKLTRAARIYFHFPPMLRKVIKREYLATFTTSPSNFGNRLKSPRLAPQEVEFFEQICQRFGGPKEEPLPAPEDATDTESTSANAGSPAIQLEPT